MKKLLFVFAFLFLSITTVNAQTISGAVTGGSHFFIDQDGNDVTGGFTVQVHDNESRYGGVIRVLRAGSDDEGQLGQGNNLVSDYAQWDFLAGPSIRVVSDDDGNFISLSAQGGVSVSTMNQTRTQFSPVLTWGEDTSVVPVVGGSIGFHSDVFAEVGAYYGFDRDYFGGRFSQNGFVTPFISFGVSM